MEFDEMKKIWDTQNEEPLYAIDEAALHRRINSRKDRARRLNNMNDFGLIAVCIVTAIIYSILTIVNDTPNVFDYLIVIALLFIASYIWYGRIRREQHEQSFDHTMLGDLDHAISSVQYNVSRSKNMTWWFVVPLAILVFMKMTQADVSLWKWLGIGLAFALSIFITRWDYNRCLKPRLRNLEALRDKLTETEV